MKKTKTIQNEQAENITRDFVLANQLSGKVHGGLSRIRLSLTFRIAWHYCIQLIRSFIPACVIVTVLFCAASALPVSRQLKKAEEKGPLSQETQICDYLTAANTDVHPEEKLFDRIRQQSGIIFSSETWKGHLSFYYSSISGEEWLVTVQLGVFVKGWLCLILALLLCDIFRGLYFFRHERRLNKRVLAPIRDIASMAATLSENNLSNRINIAGTQNELKDLANVINSMLDRIERSYNSQKQFVSDASHELRTPIAVIRGYTDMLNRWGKDDPEVLSEGIAAISQETEGMKELVESLLFLARHDKKTLMMEMSAFDPNEILSEVIKEESMVHQDYRFELSDHMSTVIEADRNMIKQVLRILCDNAVKYSQPDTTITLSCRTDDEGICRLSVRDQGQGISAEDLPKIFDRFYRSDKARQSETGGHGLGLSIARIIVIAHDGKIKVKSKPGAGTEFTVELPGRKPAT